MNTSTGQAANTFTSMIANQLTYYSKWTDFDSWASGALPVPGDDVVIEANYRVMVNIPLVDVNSLIVKGVLFFDDTMDIEVRATKIEVIEG